MPTLRLTDIAAGAQLRAKTLSEWRRKGLPGRQVGRAFEVDAAEVLQWLQERRWQTDSLARSRVVAYLQSVLGLGPGDGGAGAAPPEAPRLIRIDPSASAAADVARRATPDMDALRPEHQRAAIANLYAQIQAQLADRSTPTTQRASLMAAASRLLTQGEGVRRNALEDAQRMRRLVPVGEAMDYARDLAISVKRVLDRMPGRVVELVHSIGMDVEEAVTVACSEAGDECAVALEAGAAAMQEGSGAAVAG